jgi:hypothetical protein
MESLDFTGEPIPGAQPDQDSHFRRSKVRTYVTLSTFSCFVPQTLLTVTNISGVTQVA